MGRLAKSVFTFSSVLLLSLGSFASNDPGHQVTYNASVERVYAAETQAFGTAPTSSEKDKCVVNYQSTSNHFRLLWTATCKDIGNGQVGVTLTVQGQWFFGVADEKSRIAKIFWDNMYLILNGAVSTAPSPLVGQPAPALAPQSAQPAPAPSPLVDQPAPSLSPLAASETATLVQISSEPSGADITVDGDYTGSTPSQLKLKSGSHSVKITKKGFEPWERSIKVESGESRNIAAELEKSSQ
jgi:PEGA domain-containing protein